LTWEWAAGLRSYAHPAIFAALYWAMKVLRLDTAWAVAKGPQLLQAGFAAVADVHVYHLAKLLFGAEVAR
jgi:phosphatidylinositol glycan class B